MPLARRYLLRDTQFVGRVSLTLRVKPLPLASCSDFWGTRLEMTSSFEVLKLLSVTGAIPKYLEEINPADSTNANIERLCFTPGGYLFEDFDRIFSEVLGRRSLTLGKIVRALGARKLSPAEIAEVIEQRQGGEISRMMEILELAGFVNRDFTFKPNGQVSKLSRYRISDNYLRFYLKYIEPNKARIKQGLFQFSGLESLLGWQSISGLQFENLVLQSIPEIIKSLRLEHEQILTAAPYFQRLTKRHPACQIDLLMTCRGNTHYLCEIKFRQRITIKVIEEVRQKVQAMALPKNSTIRPVLIYAGQLDDAVLEEDYFDRVLDFTDLTNFGSAEKFSGPELRPALSSSSNESQFKSKGFRNFLRKAWINRGEICLFYPIFQTVIIFSASPTYSLQPPECSPEYSHFH